MYKNNKEGILLFTSEKVTKCIPAANMEKPLHMSSMFGDNWVGIIIQNIRAAIKH